MVTLYKPDGNEKTEWYKNKTSETFTNDDMVYINTDGYVTKYTDGASAPLLGLVKKTITATSSEYSTSAKVPVLVLSANSVLLADVSTGSAAQTDVGEYIDVDDHNSVDVAASTNNDFYVVGVVSTTQVLVKPSRLLGRVIE